MFVRFKFIIYIFGGFILGLELNNACRCRREMLAVFLYTCACVRVRK